MIGGTTTNAPYIYIHEADVLKIQSIGLFVFESKMDFYNDFGRLEQ